MASCPKTSCVQISVAAEVHQASVRLVAVKVAVASVPQVAVKVAAVSVRAGPHLVNKFLY